MIVTAFFIDRILIRGLTMSAKLEVPHFGLFEKWKRWRRLHLTGSVDQAGVWHEVEENSRWSYGYLFYVFTSAAIAILGLLQNSPAVIIGAMLVAPLMGPIMGMGFSLATFDFRGVKRAAKSVAYGATIAVCFTALIVLLSPIKTLTPELAARTQPNLLDLGVALFSGLAGAYATVRKKGGTIVGVAIATALMPPLATVGFGIATGSGQVAGGAFLLFMTNFMTIAFTATFVARVFGFGHHLTDKQTRLQAFSILAMFALLAIPLGVTLYKLAWETSTTAEINKVVSEAYDGEGTIDELAVNYDGEPVNVRAVVIAPQLLDEAEVTRLTRRIESICGTQARVQLTQLRAESTAAALERERLRALATNVVSVQEQAEGLARWVEERTGVPRDDMLLDPERKRLEFTMHQNAEAPLQWADFRQIERDAEAANPGWTVRLTPPALDPIILVAGEGSSSTLDANAVELMGWASQRLKRPLLVSRDSDDAADAVSGVQIAGGQAALVDGDPDYRWGEAE